MNKDPLIPSDWLYPASIEKATLVQKELASRVLIDDSFDPPLLLGGMDTSNNLKDPEEMIYAVTVALDSATLKVKEHAEIAAKQTLPYVPGFLGFREAPALVESYRSLILKPDLIFIDGHGISHPRSLGIASHVGVLLDAPTIGVAKSILVGKPEGVLGSYPGDQIPLIWKGKQIAMLLRSKARCNPLIISAGHRISLQTAIGIVLQAMRGYRLPEPTRQAHLAANVFRKSKLNPP